MSFVETGDVIALSVRDRSIELRVAADELQRRKAATAPAAAGPAKRGYDWLYSEFVTQAESGCDFRFLQGSG